jgi:hypothetical protein
VAIVPPHLTVLSMRMAVALYVTGISTPEVHPEFPPRPGTLTFGRLLIVTRVLEEGWSVAAAAESVGVSRATAHKWIRRFREEGLAGLQDRSSAPQHLPRALPRGEVARIVRARRASRLDPTGSLPSSGTRAPPSTGCCDGMAFHVSRTSTGRRGCRSATSAPKRVSSSTST